MPDFAIRVAEFPSCKKEADQAINVSDDAVNKSILLLLLQGTSY